jgi:hypothetical protein
MNDARTTSEIGSPIPLRAQRREAALVAQYIHELSDRHAGSRHGSPAVTGRPRTGSAADHTTVKSLTAQEAREALGAPTR